jgi:hypothetical protein
MHQGDELNLTKPVVMDPLHSYCEQAVGNPVETLFADA